jgi:hypothetical protein
MTQLPVEYAVPLRLSEAGASTELIARAVGVAPEAVGWLLRVAEAKLRERLDAPG